MKLYINSGEKDSTEKVKEVTIHNQFSPQFAKECKDSIVATGIEDTSNVHTVLTYLSGEHKVPTHTLLQGEDFFSLDECHIYLKDGAMIAVDRIFDRSKTEAA